MRPNIFQQICLFNWIDFLGADDMAGMEMFFNKNLITGSTRLDPDLNQQTVRILILTTIKSS